MRQELTLSAVLHFALIALALLAIPREPKPLDLPEVAIPIDLVDAGPVTNARIGNEAPAAAPPVEAKLGSEFAPKPAEPPAEPNLSGPLVMPTVGKPRRLDS